MNHSFLLVVVCSFHVHYEIIYYSSFLFSDVPFPKTFHSQCKKILARLFRVFVHVYIHHFDRLVAIGAEAHVNTCYKHFYYFVCHFDLVSECELEPLKEMTSHICKDPPCSVSDASVNSRFN